MAPSKMSVYADRLRSMQTTVNDQMANYIPGGDRLPDGIYIGKEAAELTESSSSGNLMVKRQFTVADGEYTGRNGWDNLVIENNETGVQICRRWIELHGCPWPEDDLGKLEQVINRINDINCLVKFRVKTTTSNKDGQEYTNISVMALLDDAPDFSDITGVPAEAGEPEATPEAAEPEAAAESTDDTLDGMTREQLKKYIAGNPDLAGVVRVTIKWTDDDIRKAIREALGTAAPEAEPEQPSDEPAIADLLTFCASQGIEEVDDSMEAAAIIEVMSGYGFNRAELTPEEIAMLEALGLSANIKAPAPAARPAPKPAAPAPRPAPAKPAAPARPAAPAARPAPKPAAPAPRPGAPKLTPKPAAKATKK